MKLKIEKEMFDNMSSHVSKLVLSIALISMLLFGDANEVFGEVVKNLMEKTDCLDFFLYQTEPKNLPKADSYKKICQRLQNASKESEGREPGGFYSFATLYDTKNKIPVYSAYTLGECVERPKEEGDSVPWNIEPQLEDEDKEVYMRIEDEKEESGNGLKKQASSKDYKDSGYDKAHLNPSLYHCGQNADAVYTLTNSAPFAPYLNRVDWAELERDTLKIMMKECFGGMISVGIKDVENRKYHLSANAYFITGVIPGTDTIDGTKVIIPKAFYTAACCYDIRRPYKKSMFSFGFYAKNKRNSQPEILPVNVLGERIQEQWEPETLDKPVVLFTKGCDVKDHRVLKIMKQKLDRRISLRMKT